MEYRCISADSHIDLAFLPHDLFVSNASQAMKERMPYVTQGPDGPRWVTKSGVTLGGANGKGGTGAYGGNGATYVSGQFDRLDRIASTGLFADGAKGICRPTTPELRLQDQDRDGIQAEVIYGLHHSANKMTDRDAALEFYRIYNDWLFSFCSYDHKRLVGLASIPTHSVEVAAAEARRVAKLGLRGIELSFSWDTIPLWNPYWDPLWKVAAEANLPVHFHTIGPRPDAPLPEHSSGPFKLLTRANKATLAQIPMAAILCAVIHSGALERYSNLRIVLGESGIGWIPYILVRMDSEYDNVLIRQDLPLKMKPSDYWRRQCGATFQDDPIGIKLLDDVGIENIMWANDYPHGDGVFPDSQEHIKRQFGRLPGATQRKICCENAGKLYGLIPA